MERTTTRDRLMGRNFGSISTMRELDTLLGARKSRAPIKESEAAELEKAAKKIARIKKGI